MLVSSMKLVSSSKVRLADMDPVAAAIATLARTASTSALQRSGSKAPPYRLTNINVELWDELNKIETS